MKPCSEGFRAKLRTGHTTLARIWTLTLKNGSVFYFTDADQDIYYNTFKFSSEPGITISAIADSIKDGFQDATIDLALNENGITQGMARYSDLGGATFFIERIFWDAVELGTLFDFAGSIRDVVITDRDKLELSVNGAGSLSGGIQIGEVYSERCRNVFGDFRCKVDLLALSVPFQVVAVGGAGNVFYMSAEPKDTDDTDAKTLTEKFLEPGDYQYTVPNRKFLEITVAGGGGSTASMGPFGEGYIYRPGDPGGPSGFLSVVAEGGGGARIGGFNGEPAGNGEDGGGQGGDAILAGKGGAGSKASGPAGLLGSSVSLFFGGNGGLVTKRLTVGAAGTTDGDVRVGDVINIYVGGGGYFPLNEVSDINPEFNGQPGYIYVSARGGKFALDSGYNFGTILWTSGKNMGRISAVTNLQGQTVTLDYNIGAPVEPNDQGLFRPGCNHYRSDCMKYNNIKNYRGEPDVPNYQGKVKGIDSDYPPANTTAEFFPMGA